MFGHNDNQQPNSDDHAAPSDDSQVQPDSSFADEANQANPDQGQAIEPTEPAHEEAAPQPPAVLDDVVSPAGGYPTAPSFKIKPHTEHKHKHQDEPAHHDEPSKPNDDLVAIRQHALDELTPLVSQLDLPPEELFRTLMMMIQANDKRELIDDAFKAANNITDDKVRGQALLDIVNEINYFTQPPAA